MVLIILLNFLIALISQTYEKVLTDEKKTKYEQRCELTWECTLLREQMPYFGNEKHGYVFTMAVDAASLEDSETEWTGYVSTIKNKVEKEAKKTTMEVKAVVA